MADSNFQQTAAALAERIVELRDRTQSRADRQTLADAANAVSALVAALKPFADLGVGSGPDYEHDAAPYRLTRGSIRNARAALANAPHRGVTPESSSSSPGRNLEGEIE
jgi:hypothetical protein